MSPIYCFNLNCPKHQEPFEYSTDVCDYCGSNLLLQNRYRGIKLLGKGGFGKTFEVEDLLYLNKEKQTSHKVLKILTKNEPKAIQLFQREAEVLSKLQHPGIPKVEADGYFTFWPEDSLEPLHCLVMEKIDGQNLQEWLTTRNHQPISSELAINWLKQLVGILKHLHENPQQQYFHRDIKPSNIMLRPNGDLVLIDFGVVREITDTYIEKAVMGESGTRVVSSGYTPPEQINGKAVPQSDFYALGRTMVYLLTGKSPLEINEDNNTGQLFWLDFSPHIPPNLAKLIDYMMAICPGQRPQTTDVILQKLATIEYETFTKLTNTTANSRTIAIIPNQPLNKRVVKARKFHWLKPIITLLFELF